MGGRELIGFDLTSPIFLGGRADLRADRHFRGSLALFYMYSRPISANEAACLFYDGDSVLPGRTGDSELLQCDDSCPYAGDGECDEPIYCPRGTDLEDCAGSAGYPCSADASQGR